MSSIMTNASAMTALKTLQQTNKSLEATQSRISTGFRVAQASDNAAYWSIATTMRSDNKAMGTVQDALGLGAAQVDVAYTAMESTKDVLDNIKTKLVAASQPGVDKSKIQSEINQLQSQLEGIATAASFSGTNWLSVDSSSSDYTATQKVVSSFTRSSNGAVSITTIDIALGDTALFDSAADVAGSQTGVGLLDKGNTLTENGGLSTLTTTAAVDGTSGEVQTLDTFVAFTMDADDTISFSIATNGGEAKNVTISKATVDAALGTTDGAIADSADYAAVLTQAFTDAGVTGVTVTDGGTEVVITSDDTAAATSDVTISGVTSSTNGNNFGIMDVDITNATAADIDAYIAGVDRMAAKVTTAASDLGAVKSRIDMQKDFVTNLMDAVDRGIGALVDADMNKESTRLQALQVQQQLGIQALSIANGNAQSILALFRG